MSDDPLKTVSMDLPADLVEMARAVAAYRDVSESEVIAAIVRPILKQVVRDLDALKPGEARHVRPTGRQDLTKEILRQILGHRDR